MKQKKRRWAKFVASVKRKFWTECPKCHKPFGGHEPHGLDVVIDKKHYRIACGRCAGLIQLKAKETR